MRYLFPVVFLGTAVVAQASLQDLVNDLLPECVHSCAADILETATSCSLSDTECICSSDITTQNLLTSWLECPANSECDESEIEAMKIGPEQINTQFRGFCDNPSGASGNQNDGNDDSDDDDGDNDDDSTDGASGSENDSDDDGAEENTNEVPGNGALPLSTSNTLLAAGAIVIAATF